jgi:hypothetical protein
MLRRSLDKESKDMDAISRLLAIEEIKQLKARYFRFLDTRNFTAMADVFCSDALFDYSEGLLFTPVGGKPLGIIGPITRGRDAIMAWISGSFAHQPHCTTVTATRSRSTAIPRRMA